MGGGASPDSAIGKEPASPCRRLERPRFDPWSGKSPWRRAWQPTSVFLLGESCHRGAWWAMVRRASLVGGTSLNCPLKVSPLASPSLKSCQLPTSARTTVGVPQNPQTQDVLCPTPSPHLGLKTLLCPLHPRTAHHDFACPELSWVM